MRTLAIAALFITTSAFACPDLSGTYAVCRSQTGNSLAPTDLIITQAVTSKITTYTMITTDADGNGLTETIVADGKTIIVSETDEDAGMTLSIETTNSCVGSKKLNTKMVVKFNGQDMGTVNSNMSKTGKTVTISAHSVDMNGAETTETVICE